MGIFSFVKAGKKTFEIVKPKIAKNLTTKRNIQDKVVKAVDEGTKQGMKRVGSDPKFLTSDQKRKLKQSMSKQKREKSKELKDYSYRLDELRKKKATGGRVGKMGGGMMGRRMGYQAGSKKGKVPTTPKEKAFRMLSVNKGLDNNKNITFTDKIAGATGGKKKKKA